MSEDRKKSSLPFVKDIIDSIEKIETYCEGMTYEAFIEDNKTKDAVVRNLEIIGEAAKNVPKTAREKALAIPWKSIAGMRDKLIHEYSGISYATVWETVKEDLPTLMKEIAILYEYLRNQQVSGGL